MPETPFRNSSQPDQTPVPPRRAALGILVVGFGVAISVTACVVTWRAERLRMEAEFEQRAHRTAQLVVDGLQRQQDTLYALRNLFHFSPQVSREAFAGAAHELIQRQTGVRALEWIQRVPGAERAAFESRQRLEGMADFEFRERIHGNTLRRMEEKREYFPVVFIEPLAGNEPALGFDLQSGVTWPVMEKIAETNELAASGRLPLLTNSARPDWGYVMELPVYEQPTPATPEARRARLRGYVLGIYHIAQTLEALFAKGEDDILDILFIDRSATRPELQFLHYQSNGRRVPNAADAPTTAEFSKGLHLRVPVDHAGRHWEIWFRPRSEWVAAQSQMRSWLVLALGLAMTGFVGNTVFGAVRRERRVGQLVAERTAELRATQTALEEDIRQRREAERQLGNVISQLSGAAFRCAFDVRFTALFASDGMMLLTGHAAEEFVAGRVHIGDLTLPEDRPLARRAVAAGVRRRSRFEFEARIRHQDGAIRCLLVRGRPVFADDGTLRFLEGLAIDVTALKAAEAEKIAFERKLLETQKLESLGVLAGGIAHDFNNLLTAMLGNATLARDVLPENSPGTENLAQIESAARRAADLCQQMLAYAGKREMRASPVCVSGLVRSTTALLRVSIRKSSRLELRLADQLPSVLADPAQLQQIVMNLVINAADAIGERPGEIVVSTFQQQADAAFLRNALHHPELPAGRYVGIEVRDNGCGMSRETLARIFEPFLTTKFSGRGLGLAAVLGIVQRHHGALFVESELGRGSVFRLLLRAHDTAVPDAAPQPDGLPQLRGTVLIIDDEEAVREVLATVLRRSGMTAHVAGSGEEGLRVYAGLQDHVDLVLLDLTMPGWSGEETLRALRARNATQRVILMSGFSERATVERCRALGVTDFVAKPFELQGLMTKLQPLVG